MATKLSFSLPNQSFFDRLDIFSNDRLLKITLVLLFFGEIHYLPSLTTIRDFGSRSFFHIKKNYGEDSGGNSYFNHSLATLSDTLPPRLPRDTSAAFAERHFRRDCGEKLPPLRVVKEWLRVVKGG